MAAKGYGEILKKAREAKDLTHVELHKILKMDPSYLKALEEENLVIFEKPVYMRFFLKTYAKHLKVDLKEVMRLYDFSPEVQEAAKKTEKHHNHMSLGDIIKETEPRELEAAKGTKLELTMMTKNNIIIAVSVVAAIFLVLFIVFAFRGKGGVQETNNNVYVATVTAPTGLKITVKAKDDVWMKARHDNGEEDFLMKKGEERKWKDINRIVFLVGNAGGVEFTQNSDPIGVIGEPGEVINGLVFETGKNWYIDKAQGFKRENPKPMAEDTPAGTAPAAVTVTPAAQ